MGLRFRKSVTLCKGLRLNFGMGGVSVSAGTKGFRQSYHFGTGRATTSVGIPGTGLSYVTTRNTRANRRSENQNANRQHRVDNSNSEALPIQPSAQSDDRIIEEPRERITSSAPIEINESQNTVAALPSYILTSIHYGSDETIDWTEMLSQTTPPSNCTDIAFWEYCHQRAANVLNGDIDTYLQIIQDVGPLEDLMDYGFGFECGTDNPSRMVVEFHSRQTDVMPDKSYMSTTEYNDLLQDYICSCAIRVARDIFALLPVVNVIVNAISDETMVLSVRFDRRTFNKVKFQGADASNIVDRFQHRMVFDVRNGFQPIDPLV